MDTHSNLSLCPSMYHYSSFCALMIVMIVIVIDIEITIVDSLDTSSHHCYLFQ